MVSPQPKHLFWVAGEPSGDAHAALVLEQLRKLRPNLRATGLGGPRLAAAGCEVLEDLASDAIMGLFPVLAALPRIRRWFRLARAQLETERPDVLVLVDYPGFNLRLARIARRLGIPVIYYISPQIWAWNRQRIRRLEERVDLMLVILPFEANLYRESGLESHYVGHPLIDHRESVGVRNQVPPAAQGVLTIGLFPGSRRHVVRALQPVFSRAARELVARWTTSRLHFLCAAANPKLREELENLGGFDGLSYEYVTGNARSVMERADFCWTTSGTTTLEITLSGKPMILAYRVSPILYLLGRCLIRVPYIGLVNLVAERRVVPELIGVRNFSSRLVQETTRLLSDENRLQEMKNGLDEVSQRLGGPGSSLRAARLIDEFLDRPPQNRSKI